MSVEDQNKKLEHSLAELLDKVALNTVVNCAYSSKIDDASLLPPTTLLYVRFNEDMPQVHSLARFLWKQCVNYALSRKRRIEFQKTIQNAAPGDISATTEIVRVVRDVFVDFNKKYPSRASEVGEVLAYCVAVHHLQAAQVAAKMSLKTSTNMPIHGLDGIHATFDSGQLSIYFLESKLSQTANAGVREFAESVAGFSKNEKQYLREYELVGDLGNLDVLEGEVRKLALDHFDVIGKPEIQRRERYVGVICYSEKKHFSNVIPVSDGPTDIHEKHFSGIYGNEGRHHYDATLKHLKDHGANPNKCIVFFVAVPSVDKLREAFYSEMGISEISHAQKPEGKKK
ncbi:DUF1837 domain-containing protein [Undibacterium sp.]|uniref:HamA C-terminal domain-containing protein n=1 Tax=Undibacterium sp. TaxID=1914977 RepID=UPI0027317803|nr:DUF1837 domain-containing protein [Undibacterium sp.]MDP1978336.1 DUF1837 domain-containing protein [Undibacterium sp.]